MSDSRDESPSSRPTRGSDPSRSRRRQTPAGVLALIAALVLIGIIAPGILPAEGAHIGFYSVMPALVTLALVFLTRDVVTSLFIGIITGGVVSGRFNVIDQFFIPAIGSANFATILLVYLWALGGLIGI